MRTLKIFIRRIGDDNWVVDSAEGCNTSTYMDLGVITNCGKSNLIKKLEKFGNYHKYKIEVIEK